MRNIVISLFLLCCPAVVSAQDDGIFDRRSVATNMFWNNWFVQGGVSWNAWYGGIEDGQGWSKSPFSGFRSNPGLSIAVGKWFTPGLGLRTKLSGIWGRAVYGETASANDNKYWMFDGQVLFNFGNLFYGYSPDRRWDFIPFVGAGIARSCTYNRYSPAFSVGVLNQFWVSDRLSVNVELGWNRYENGLAGMTSEMGEGFMDHQNKLYAEVGVTFRLGRKTWQRVIDMNATNDFNQTQLDALNAMLEDERADNERLRARLDDKVEPSAVATSVSFAPVSVFFQLDSANVSDIRQLVNLQSIADYSVANNAKLLVVGYADSHSGTAKSNLDLSRRRAESIAESLVGMGVKRENIIVEARGEDETFANPAHNRRVTVELSK